MIALATLLLAGPHLWYPALDFVMPDPTKGDSHPACPCFSTDI